MIQGGFFKMARRFNKEKLKAFLIRRRINAFGLFIITVISALITLLGALFKIPYKKLDLLFLVTAALIVLCFIQAFKMRKSFRTIRSFKGHRKKNASLKHQTEN